eukprot:GHVU01149134.1.p2 GENE.GHVU01149134.1~~GHVU01149134.1.p2  ORF type:complete len:110 (-),score=6.07 GHVU01149134.1:315-644(-)
MQGMDEQRQLDLRKKQSPAVSSMHAASTVHLQSRLAAGGGVAGFSSATMLSVRKTREQQVIYLVTYATSYSPSGRQCLPTRTADILEGTCEGRDICCAFVWGFQGKFAN